MRPLLCVVFIFAGCGLAPSANCTFTNQNRCQERLNSVSAETFKATCSASQGTSGDGACKSEGKVGGCFIGKQGDGSAVNDWFYSPKTKAEVQTTCADDGTTFLEP